MAAAEITWQPGLKSGKVAVAAAGLAVRWLDGLTPGPRSATLDSLDAGRVSAAPIATKRLGFSGRPLTWADILP
jgi:hypothetical protein